MEKVGSRRSALLVVALVGCAGPNVVPSGPRPPPISPKQRANASIPTAETEEQLYRDDSGLLFELIVEERAHRAGGGGSHKFLLRQGPPGGTLQFDMTPDPEFDGSVVSETFELAPIDAAFVSRELTAAMSRVVLACEGSGERRHELRIKTRGTHAVLVCHADATPASWLTLETIFASAYDARRIGFWTQESWDQEIQFGWAPARRPRGAGQ